MRVSLDWLKQYVDIEGLSPETIAEALTNAGLEVESIETVGAAFSGVVVGLVQSVSPHPNADKLRLVDVDLGSLGQKQVVCGAPNVRPGIRIAYAQLGAKVINRKEGGLFELKPIAIRGVESAGMVCSIDELGLQEQYPKTEDGIWPLDDYTQKSDLGRDLKDVLGLSADIVLEVAPTANRGDHMSMRGVAREVAALFERTLTLPEPKVVSLAGQCAYSVHLSNSGVCRFYAGALIENVTIQPSPAWLVQQLTSAGIRSINNVVDITNYVMLEYGQPLHAFDADTLKGGKTIGVRLAQTGEKITTLDAVERPLSEESVVVTLDEAPIALAGVMGGQQTEIKDTTQHVFLEAAFFPSASTRRSARSVGIRTDSSARFERGVDEGATEQAFYRAIALIEELAGGQLVSTTQADSRQLKPITLPLTQARMTRILGLEIPDQAVEAILTRLGFGLSMENTPGCWMVTVPTFRGLDVNREIDLIEEVVRVYGYDKIPYTLPQDIQPPQRTPRSQVLKRICETMVGCGFHEVATLSLIGEKLLEQTGMMQNPDTTVSVTNSHSIDHRFLRQSLIPNLLEIAKHNQDQGQSHFWAFELGKSYQKKGKPNTQHPGVQETLLLSAILLGHPQQGVWHQASTIDFYTVKGVVDRLIQVFGLSQSVTWQANETDNHLHPGQTAQLTLGKLVLGSVGTIHPLLQDKLKLKSPAYLFELNVDMLSQALLKRPPVTAVEAMSVFPAVKRDIAFSAPLSLPHAQIEACLIQSQEPLLQEIELFDEYTGQQVEAGTRSLAYRLTLQSLEATLTDPQIDAAVAKLKKQLETNLAVTFR